MVGVWVGLWGMDAVGLHGGSPTSTGQSPNLISSVFALPGQNPHWWQFISSAFVHVPLAAGTYYGVAHIFFNCFFMWMVGRLVEAMYGRWVLLGTFLLSAIPGSVFFLLVNALNLTNAAGAVGASGGLCGFLTLMLVVGVREGRQVPASTRDSLRSFSGRNVVFILIYSLVLSGQVAVGGHIG